MTQSKSITIPVSGEELDGTVMTPAAAMPGLLFLHGWGGSQEQDLRRARELAGLGCVCLTFDLRGHAGTRPLHESVTREESLADALAAYDTLAAHPAVDTSTIAVVGSSYGGYLAVLLSELREVQWLALRVPALYEDKEWSKPKWALDRERLAIYRSRHVLPEDNRALRAAMAFNGDVLIVESEHDHLVPHAVIANYLAAFRRAHSLTYRVIEGADHALSEERCKLAYNGLLVRWATEMILGARSEGGAIKRRLSVAE